MAALFTNGWRRLAHTAHRHVWRPFWEPLDRHQRAEYLEHWKASSAWREAIEFHFTEDPSFDAETDARESVEYLARYRQEKAAKLARKPWWARLFHSGD